MRTPKLPDLVMATTLLLIDPQNDFMDQPGASLPVAGAIADMRRVADFIRRNLDAIDDIVVTLDSHEVLDIGHNVAWRDRSGQIPAPFTQVTYAQARNGDFRTADAGRMPRVLQYLSDLEAGGRYTHTLWPVHCQVGSAGHNIQQDILAACNEWELKKTRGFERVLKGQNPNVESYSAIRAEVVDPLDPRTDTNRPLLERLGRADRILVAGEALSHCVAATVNDVIQLATAPADVMARKIVLFRDGSSPVAGFEAQGERFLKQLTQGGGTVASLA